MQLKNYLFIIKNRIVRSKVRTTISCMFLLLSLIIVSSSLLLFNYLDKYNEYSINNNLDYHKIFVDSETVSEDQMIKDVNNIEGVLYACNQYYYTTYGYCNELKKNETIAMYGCNNKTCPNVISGRKIKDQSSEIIIPQTSENSKNMIGKKVTIINSDKNNSKQFEIVGVYVYDLGKQTYGPIYMDFRDKNMFATNLHLPDTTDGGRCPIIAVIEDYKQIPRILNDINNMGYNVSKGAEANQATMALLYGISFALSFIFIFASIITIIFTTKIDIRKNTRELALYKVMGYKNNHINKIIIIEQLLLSLIIFIIGYAISQIVAIKIFIKGCNKFIFKNHVGFSLSPQTIIIGIFLTFVIPLFFKLFYIRKIKKISLITASKTV